MANVTCMSGDINPELLKVIELQDSVYNRLTNSVGLFPYSDWFLRKSISKFDERKFLGCHVPERYEGFCREFRKSLTRFNVLISEEHSSRFSLKSNKSVTQSVRLGDSRKNKPSFSASRNSVFAPHLSACQCGLSNLVLYLGF